MKKAPTPLELELAAEAELARLQRQYRTLESDRNAFFSGAMAGSKTRVIEVLKEERDDLDLTLGVAKSAQNQRKDERLSEHLTDLLERYDKYDEDIRRGRIEIAELEAQIQSVQRQIIAMSKFQVTDAQYQKKIDNTAKAVTKYENQLDTEIKKFNNVMADNTRLRREIEHMLLQRHQFNRLWNHLVKNLKRGKRFMLDLIEQATMAYDQREELCQKLEALKHRGAMDLALHTQEMRQLQRKLNHDGKLQQYLAVKGQRRVLLDLEEREAAKRKMEQQLKESQVEQYKELLQRITEFCGEEDIDKLAVQFKKQEADNFSLFTYVTELNHEVDGLTDKIIKLKADVDGERETTAWRKEHETQRLIELQAQLDETKETADKEEERMRDCDDRLNTLLNGIKELFHMIEADDSPIRRRLGDTVEVTLNNVLLYLEIIETRTNEIMQMVYFVENDGELSPEFAVVKPPSITSSEIFLQGEEEEEEEGYNRYGLGDIEEILEEQSVAERLTEQDEETVEAVQDLEVSAGEEQEAMGEQEPDEAMERAAGLEDDEAASAFDDAFALQLGVPEKKKVIRESVRPHFKPEPVDKIMYTQPCPLCVEAEEIDFSRMEEDVQPLTREEVIEKLKERMQLPDIGNRLHNTMVDPFRADAEMLQDCWFTADRDTKPSPVVLHDRLMTDAALGTLPIKSEHSYSLESDGDSGPASPVNAVDDMEDECFASIPMQFATCRSDEPGSMSPVTVKEEPYSDDADSLDSSRANSPDEDDGPEPKHFVFDHKTATIQVTHGHNGSSTNGSSGIMTSGTGRQQSLLRATAAPALSLSPNSRSAALFGAINPSSVHARCQPAQLQVKLEAGVVVTHNPAFGSPPTPPSSTSSDADSEGNLSPEHETSPHTSNANGGTTNARRSQHAGARLYHQSHAAHTTRQPIHTPLISSQPKGSTGILMLTEEEKRTLLAEGYPIPTRLPLTKAEEKSLKKIRRKIKNKISAQESRRKKKEYMDQLERKVEVLVSENCDYRKRVEKLEDSNANLISQLAKLQAIVSRQHRK